jgi:hypothetical protein
MATLTYHRKPNGTTYVYRQESYWDKSKGRSATKQVCIGKLGSDGEVIYNKRFASLEARQALEKGERVSESVITGQSKVLDKATNDLGLYLILRKVLGTDIADMLISLAWATVALDGKMYHGSIWIEQNQCPAHDKCPSSQAISRYLAGITEGDIESFLSAWMAHRDKGAAEQYCFDITSVSSFNTSNPFVEYGHNRDRERLAQINLALLTSVTTRIPVFYEIHPGSLNDVKTIASFSARMKKYGAGRIRMLLDRGFYSASNIQALQDAHIGFLMPIPANVKTAQELIDQQRDDLEMPEHIIKVSANGKDAVYGMSVLGKMGDKRVWRHIYYDSARRSEHILSFFADLTTWEEELISGKLNEANKLAYERYFIVKTTPKRGRQVKRNQEAINEYKSDRAGYWTIITNCEKDATKALAAYRERSLVELQFDDLKNKLDMARLRTHGKDTMQGRVLVQFLALVLCTQIRNTLDVAWTKRHEDKDNGFSRRYTLSEVMLRLGTYRKTRFSGHYGEVVSTPTKAQRQLFAAFGLDEQAT